MKRGTLCKEKLSAICWLQLQKLYLFMDWKKNICSYLRVYHKWQGCAKNRCFHVEHCIFEKSLLGWIQLINFAYSAVLYPLFKDRETVQVYLKVHQWPAHDHRNDPDNHEKGKGVKIIWSLTTRSSEEFRSKKLQKKVVSTVRGFDYPDQIYPVLIISKLVANTIALASVKRSGKKQKKLFGCW